MRAWIEEKGFSSVGEFETEYELDDIHVLIGLCEGSVTKLIIAFDVGMDARVRRGMWSQFVDELSSKWDFLVLDDAGGLTHTSRFFDVLEASFAWDCFLKREQD